MSKPPDAGKSRANGTPPGGVDPREIAALFQQAVAHHQAGRAADAERLYWEIIDKAPGHAEAHQNLGLIAYQAGFADPAIEHLSAAARLNPRGPVIQSNLGLVLQAVGRLPEALACFERAVALKPDYADAWLSRGYTLGQLQRPGEALASYDRALALAPGHPKVLVNRGVALRDLGRIAEARESFALALRAEPGFVPAHLGAALTDLVAGDFARGLPEYEWRWRDSQLVAARREFREPLWLGREPLAGRTILLHAEQGFGDTLQFCRYASLLAEQGARVLLQVQAPLTSLLRSLAGPSVVLGPEDPLPAFDCQTPLLSLPLACGTTLGTIPAPAAYLAADPERVARWQQVLGAKQRPRVGLVWSGNAAFRKDLARSVPLARLAPLLRADAEFISLQQEVRADEVEDLRGTRIRHFGPELTDFAATAALATCCDLVVTVDTATAHLAGALGRPVWVLLPAAPDWRWLRERSDSPWYPSARLLRQADHGDWAPVIEQVRRELEGFPGMAIPRGTP